MASSSEEGKESHPVLQPSAIGSDSWKGGGIYEEGDEYNVESHKFFEAFRWDLLASIASRCRGGLRCGYIGKFSIGQFNMVRRLDFDDGVRWVARVRLPPEATPAPLHWYDTRRAFDIEVASMKFFKSMSTVPVPEVFAYDGDASNEVGASYMFIEYIHGATAEELGKVNRSESWSFGTVEQDRKLRDQMAKIQAEVSSFTFPSIGSLYYSEETRNFFIGPDLDTGKGPWSSSSDYYRDLTNELLKRTMTRCNQMTTDSPSFALPTLLNHLLSTHGEETTGPFRLMNRDFGPHNILVDNDFNIVGIVDFDGIVAAPLEAVAQYPVFSCMTLYPPGFIEAHPLMAPRIESEKPLLARYKEFLTMYESELYAGSAVVGPRLGSTAAVAYQGLLRYARLTRSTNEKWFASALIMLREYAKRLV